MRDDIIIAGLVPVTENEAALVIGGADKKAQDALYTIGYVLGVICRFIGSLFAWTKKSS